MKSLGATLKYGLQKVAQKGGPCNVGDLDLIPGLERSHGEGYRLPTPVFWPGEVHGVHGLTNSQTQLSDFHFQFSRVCSTHTARLNVASYFVAYDNEDKMD